MAQFSEKKLLNIKCVSWFSLQLLSETFLILWINQWDIIINVHRCSCKVPITLMTYWCNLKFLDIFSKNTQISNFMKICPLGAEPLHADGETETDRRDEASSHYSQFCTYTVKRISVFQCAGNCEQWAAHLLCIYNYPSIFLLDKEPPMQLTQQLLHDRGNPINKILGLWVTTWNQVYHNITSTTGLHNSLSWHT
jgi:hypothetical protein